MSFVLTPILATDPIKVPPPPTAYVLSPTPSLTTAPILTRLHEEKKEKGVLQTLQSSQHHKQGLGMAFC